MQKVLTYIKLKEAAFKLCTVDNLPADISLVVSLFCSVSAQHNISKMLQWHSCCDARDAGCAHSPCCTGPQRTVIYLTRLPYRPTTSEQYTEPCDLDPVTLIYEPHLGIQAMYLCTRNELSTS